jgi:hypothetical protein
MKHISVKLEPSFSSLPAKAAAASSCPNLRASIDYATAFFSVEIDHLVIGE